MSACSLFSLDETGSASGAATLTVTGLTAGSRTALPLVDATAFTSLVLLGCKSGGSEEPLGSWSSWRAMSISAVELSVGSWTFTLSAQAGGVSYSGSTSAVIVSGSNSIAFNLALASITYTGSGGLHDEQLCKRRDGFDQRGCDRQDHDPRDRWQTVPDDLPR